MRAEANRLLAIAAPYRGACPTICPASYIAGLVVFFAQTAKPNPIKEAGGPCVSQVGSGTMQIIRECRMRATILTAIAKDAPELESQLRYVAQKWLTLAVLREQLHARRPVHGSSGPSQLR